MYLIVVIILYEFLDEIRFNGGKSPGLVLAYTFRVPGAGGEHFFLL